MYKLLGIKNSTSQLLTYKLALKSLSFSKIAKQKRIQVYINFRHFGVLKIEHYSNDELAYYA